MFNLSLLKWLASHGVDTGSGLRSAFSGWQTADGISVRRAVQRSDCVVDVKLTTFEVSYKLPPFTDPRAFVWTVFFTADGSRLTIGSDTNVYGNCTVWQSWGNHGDLGGPAVVTNPDGSQTWTYQIPGQSIGERSTTVSPIPLDPSLQPVANEVTFPGSFGMVVAVLRQGTAIPDHAIEKGHEAFTNGLYTGINGILRTLNASNRSFSDNDIKNLTDQVSGQVTDAIKNDLTWYEALAVFLAGDNGKDSNLGSPHWVWDQDALLAKSGTELDLDASWGDANVTYRIRGHRHIQPV